MKTCAFTGHRPARFHFKFDETDGDCTQLKERIRGEIILLIQRGVTTFLSGMALGVDLWAAELVLALKKEYPQIQLVCVIPWDNQPDRWQECSRKRYFHILSQCDKTVHISRSYTKSCIFERNRYLVERADCLLAVYDGSPKGGTAYTVGYAYKMKRLLIIIPPEGAGV